MYTLELTKKVESSLRAGHPWVYRDAVATSRLPPPGTLVKIVDSGGKFVGVGFAEAGPLAARLWSLHKETIDVAFFRHRMEQAAELRKMLVPPHTDAYRLLHGENDFLPGVLCDVYDNYAVLQTDGSGVSAWMPLLREALIPLLKAQGVFNLLWKPRRSENRAVEILYGQLPPKEIEVLEHNMVLCVNVVEGQKTGLFLDHRESRKRLRDLCQSKSVLNLYGYTGGFSVSAGLGGARYVTTVDQSKQALALAVQSWQKNGLDPQAHHAAEGDVPAYVEARLSENCLWDVIVADPPSFAPNQASVSAALKSYRKLHSTCLRLLKPGGYYLAASCSSHIRRDAFQNTLMEAAQRNRQRVQVVDAWGAAPDHPCRVGFPEGEYLKALLIRLMPA